MDIKNPLICETKEYFKKINTLHTKFHVASQHTADSQNWKNKYLDVTLQECILVITSPKYWKIYITSVKALGPVNYATKVSYVLY